MAKAGMPMGDPAKAREWRALYVRPMRRPELGQVVHDNDNDRDHGRDQRAPNIVDLYATEAGEGQLEDTIPRLRRLEKATALALERAIRDDNITAAVALRREHCTALRTLYASEEKLIKINESRGRLVTVDRTLGMINESLQEVLLTVRRLPDLGRDEVEKGRLTAFLNGVLDAVRRGAEEGLKRSVSA
jgi:hypothetical protein